MIEVIEDESPASGVVNWYWTTGVGVGLGRAVLEVDADVLALRLVGHQLMIQEVLAGDQAGVGVHVAHGDVDPARTARTARAARRRAARPGRTAGRARPAGGA